MYMEKKYCHIEPFNLRLFGRTILEDFACDFDKNSAVCLLGESGSGKSLLLKTLFKNSSLIQSNGRVLFYLLQKKDASNWQEEIASLHLDVTWKRFVQKIMKVSTHLEYRFAFVLTLLEKPDFLFCEDLHWIFSAKELAYIFSFMRKKKIGCFYMTNQIEDTVYSTYLMIVKQDKMAIEGQTLLVLQEEKYLKRLGFSLPFYINMSIQLELYGLIDHLCMSKEELEKALWKLK